MSAKKLTEQQKKKFDIALKNYAVWRGSPFFKNKLLAVKSTMKLEKELGFDSLDFVEFLMEIEKKFNCGIDDSKASKIVTVGDFYKALANSLHSKKPTRK